MKIIRLQTTGFKRITAVDITPEGSLVEIRGNNAEGKSSLLDSIFAALGGAAAAPLKPIRTGEDFAAIRVELGDDQPAIIVEKYFDEVGEKLKVTTADGYKASQTDVDKLLGRMTFDPLAFARLKAGEQAVELRRLVPLKVDLDKLQADDKADLLARRDINRDGKAKVAQRDAINISGIIPERPDRDAIVARLTGAADVNTTIERERNRRVSEAARLSGSKRFEDERETTAERMVARAVELRAEADKLDVSANALRVEAADLKATREQATADLAALPPLGDPVDTAALSVELSKADEDLALLARVDERARLDAEVVRLRAEAEAFTTAIEDRAKLREKALAEAEMPVPGLGFAAFGDSEDLVVSFEGEPFSQASGAQQLRVSMALAMAANPKLRVMLIKDGSLLDANGLALVRELASAGDYQVWLEGVGEGDGTGIIMEAGSVKGAPEAERLEAPKRRKKAGDGEPDVAIVGDKLVIDGAVVPEVKSIKSESGPSVNPTPAPAPAAPTRTKRAMTSFSTKPLGGGLFGDDK
jgi:hypothetical protein